MNRYLFFFISFVLPAFVNNFCCGQAIKNDSANVEESVLKHNIAKYRENGNKEALVGSLYIFGIYHQNNSDLLNARLNFREALQLSQTYSLPAWQSNVSLKLGLLFFKQGNGDSSLYYFFKALSIAEQIKNDSLVSMACQGLGSFYKVKRKFEESHRYLDKGIEYAKRAHNDILLIKAIGNKAMAYSWEQKPNEAIALHQSILPAAEKINDHTITGYIHMNLAACYAMKQDYFNAERNIRLLEKDVSRSNDLSFACEYFMISGFLYREIKQPVLAEKSIKAALPLAKQLNLYSILQRCYDTLSLLKKEGGDYKEALEYMRKAQVYRDSTNSEKMQLAAQELEVKFHIAQKEKELSLRELQIAKKNLQLQQARQYNFYSIGATIVALLVAGLIFANFRHKKQVHLRKLNAIQKEKELQLIQALMHGEEKERSRIAKDLHDGVAGLLAAVKMHFSSVDAKAVNIFQDDSFRRGMQLLDIASGEIRKTSHNLMPEVLIMHGLDEALERYCRTISNNSLSIQYDSLGKIDRFIESFELTVYRIVQELLNNILKHSQAKKAIVQVCQQADLLTITLEDNGVGFNVNSLEKDGMGLKSLRSRIESINGKMEIDSAPGKGVSAYLEFEIAELKIRTI
jgi:signal transduction histidine kinase